MLFSKWNKNLSAYSVVFLVVILFILLPIAAATADTTCLIRTIDTSVFNPPSSDPAGLTYLSDRDRILICDSEINEISEYQGFNLFEITRSGFLGYTADTTSYSDEPTGVTFNPNNGHLYFSDDTGRRVYDLDPGSDGQYGTGDDNVTSFAPIFADPEGIAYGRINNQDYLFVAHGAEAEVAQYTLSGSLVSSFDVSQYGVSDPEGIEFNPVSGTLFVLDSAGVGEIIETTIDGLFIRTIDISAASANKPAGITYAPGSLNPNVMNFYIADRNVDNFNDGLVYELSLQCGGPDIQDILVTPLSVDYGPVLEFDSSTSSITIQNVGTAVLRVDDLSIGSGSDSEFAISSSPSLPFFIGAGGSQTVEVTYSPVDLGLDTDTLQIASDDPDEPLVTVDLAGTGVELVPDIDATPGLLDYGNVAIGDSSVLSVTIQNIGAAALTVGGINFGAGSSADFSISSSPALPVVIGVGASATVDITFSPQEAAPDTGALEISSDDPDEPLVTVYLAGSGMELLPDIDVTPLLLAYGNVVIGNSPVLNVTIQNLGAQDLEVTDIAFGSGSSSEFAFSDPSPVTIGPGGSATVAVIYSPLGLGSDSGTLEIFSDDPDEPLVMVGLTGNGIDAPPPGIIFEEVQSGGSSSSATVTTSANLTGVAGDLYLASIAFRGNVSVSAVSGLGLSWTPLQVQCAGRNQTVLEVWMAQGAPSGGGAVTASFAAAPSNAVIAVSRYSGVDAASPIGNLVSGNSNGVDGVCSGGTDSNAYAFGLTTAVDGAVVYGAAAMRNKTHTPGTGYTELIEIAQGSGGGVASTAVMHQTIASAANVLVDGTFSRAVDWAVIGLEIRPGAGADIPDINATPLLLDFSNVVIGGSPALSVTIQNMGGADLTVSDINLGAGSSTDFSISSSPALPAVIVAGGSRNVAVTYSPSAAGSDSGTLEIDSDDPDEPLVTVDLAGTGIELVPDIDATPGLLDYGNVAIGDSSMLSVTIQNIGAAALTVSGINFGVGSSADFSISSSPALPAVIVAGGSRNVAVAYSPSAAGPDSGTLEIDSDDPDEPLVTVDLTGSGIELVPDIDATPLLLDFSNVVIGGSAALNVTIQNMGGADLTVGGINLGAGSSADFSISSSPALPAVIVAGGSRNVEVTYSPSAAGPDSGTLEIDSDDLDEPLVTVDLTGNGIDEPPPGIIFEEVQSGGSSGSATVTTSANLTGVAGDLYLAAISFKPNVAVSAVSGLGLSWTQVNSQCAGRNQTGVAVWMAQGPPGGDGTVTATLATTPINAVIVVSRYSGVDGASPVGNLVSGNSNGVGGVCSGGTDSNAYAFGLTTAVDGAVAYGAAAMRNKTHTPGAGYTEQIEIAQGSGGGVASVAAMDQTIPSAANVLVDGTISRDVDWAVVGLEIRPGGGQ